MTVHIGRMLSDGIKRVLTPTGGILLVVFIAIQLLIQSSVNTLVASILPPGVATEIDLALGLTLPVSGTTAGLILAGSFILSAVYFVVLARGLTRPYEELSTFPTALYTRRIGRASLTMLITGIIVWVAIFIGTLFLFLPGIFLTICFLFVIFGVGVEDRGILSTLKRSWALSRGNRLKLAVPAIFSGVIGILIGVLSTILDLAGSALVAELITNTISSLLFIVLYGLMAAAYLQVTE